MDDIRPVRWWRVLPVKFIGGLGALGSGMVLGREGPSVQMGGTSEGWSPICSGSKTRKVGMPCWRREPQVALLPHSMPRWRLSCSWSEMRPQFRYSLISIKCVMISAIVANIVFRSISGQQAVITMPQYDAPLLRSLWLFLLLGMAFGVFGVVFNKLVNLTQTCLPVSTAMTAAAICWGLAGELRAAAVIYSPADRWRDQFDPERDKWRIQYQYTAAVPGTCRDYPVVLRIWGSGGFCTYVGIGNLVRDFWCGCPALVPRPRPATRYVRHCRYGGIVCRHGTGPDHRHFVGNRNDR